MYAHHLDMAKLLEYRSRFRILSTATYLISNSLGASPLKAKRAAIEDASKWATDGSVTSRVVDWLINMKAVLVGVDVPSVDAATSKDLAHHRASCATGIPILENFDLWAVEAGEYELIALLVRIPQANATWVQAILRR